jgi:hypothetical protein
MPNEIEDPQYKLLALSGVSFFIVLLENGEQIEIVEPDALISVCGAMRFSCGFSSGLSLACRLPRSRPKAVNSPQ